MPRDETAAPAVLGIDHVAVVVRDADSAGIYFVKQLGLARLYDELVQDVGVRLVYFGATAAPGAMVQLVQPIAASPIQDFLNTHGEGLHHVCFLVDSVATTIGRLDGESATEMFVGGRGRSACFLRTRASGVLIELTERHPSSRPVPWSGRGRPAS